MATTLATAPTTFETALREQVESRKSRRGRFLLRKLDGMRPARRKRVVARLEAHARAHLVGAGVIGATEAIDWASIDWQKWLGILLQIFLALLPFLL